ncbi:MAG: hypothetical protein JXB06_15175 [Spirochaetales bacterium]|nr:hypothetical protein [Spirochaetales bacterium]
MVFIWDLILALAIGVVLTLVFTFGFRRRGPWSNVLLFFLVVFLGAWTAGIWIPPLGPPLRGVFWVSPLMVGLILALLLAASYPATPRERSREEINLKPEVPSPVVVAMDVFFIILLIVFAAVILIGYLR